MAALLRWLEPASQKRDIKIGCAQLTSHELSFDRREPQAIDNCRREERKRSQRHTIANVGQIVREHSRTKQCLHDLPSRGMLVGISSSFDLDAGFDKLLVIVGEPLGA